MMSMYIGTNSANQLLVIYHTTYHRQVTVRVLNVDAAKKQIALTMKTEAESAAPPRQKRGGGKVSTTLAFAD